jgi:hypothetical protein
MRSPCARPPTSQREGVYQVVIAGQALRTSVVRTGSTQEFQILHRRRGRNQARPGIYRLRINAVDSAGREQLFRLKAVELVKK